MFKNLSAQALGISGRQSELIELALSHGFKGLDLDLVEFAEQAQSQGFDRASRLIVSARLKLGCFTLPVAWRDDTSQCRDDLERLAPLAEVAARLGCTRAVTLVEPSHASRVYHQNFEYHRRRLAEIAGILAPWKIRLGLSFLAPHSCRGDEGFQFIQTADELLLLVRNIGAPNVGLVLDTWHWQLGGGRLEQLSSLSPEQIVTVLLNDGTPGSTAANANLAERRLPGDGGAIDAPGVLAALGNIRYDGPVTPAPHASQFAGQARDAIVRQAGASLDRAWKAAGLGATGKLAAVPARA
jgi:sugar phosphate isomerase/epimerase